MKIDKYYLCDRFKW